MSDLHLLDNYFEDDYIGRLGSRNRRTTPTFTITFWNVDNLLTNQFDRTNNAIDDLIISSIQLLNDLQTEQSYVDGEISQLVTDFIPKPKTIQTPSRVLRILENSIWVFPWEIYHVIQKYLLST